MEIQTPGETAAAQGSAFQPAEIKSQEKQQLHQRLFISQAAIKRQKKQKLHQGLCVTNVGIKR
jgi:hypothetical protein